MIKNQVLCGQFGHDCDEDRLTALKEINSRKTFQCYRRDIAQMWKSEEGKQEKKLIKCRREGNSMNVKSVDVE